MKQDIELKKLKLLLRNIKLKLQKLQRKLTINYIRCKFSMLMKYLIFTITILFSQNLLAQKRAIPYDKEKNIIVYELISNVDSLSKEVIFDRTKFWLAQNFQETKSVIDFEDKENGKITFSGSFPFEAEKNNKMYVLGNIKFRAIVQIKDGKYKMSIYNFVHKYNNGIKDQSCNDIESVYLNEMKCKNGMYMPQLIGVSFHKSIEKYTDYMHITLYKHVTNPSKASLFTDDF